MAEQCAAGTDFSAMDDAEPSAIRAENHVDLGHGLLYGRL